MLKIDFRPDKVAWLMFFIGILAFVILIFLSRNIIERIAFYFVIIGLSFLAVIRPDNLLDSFVLTNEELQLTYYKKNRKQTRVIKKSDIQSINIKVKPPLRPNGCDSCYFSVITNDGEKLELHYGDRCYGECHTAEFFKVKDSLPNFTCEVDTEWSCITKDEYFKYVNSVLEKEKQAKEQK